MQKPQTPKDLETKCRSIITSICHQICKQVANCLKVQVYSDVQDLVAEIVWKKVSSYGADLEAFSKHAKRSNITQSDVKLLVRRNPSLKQLVESRLETISSVNCQMEGNNKRKR